MADIQHPFSFNEPEWLKLLFLLSDTQHWLDEMNKKLLAQLPVSKRRFISKNYYLTVSVLAHILERHYYKISRYPNAGKFNIPVTDILNHIRDAYALQPIPIDSGNLQRVLQTSAPIGHDKYGNETNVITIITDSGGKIVTAYPGPEEN